MDREHNSVSELDGETNAKGVQKNTHIHPGVIYYMGEL